MNVDYDIHGVLGLRLIDPTPSLARLVCPPARSLAPRTLGVRARCLDCTSPDHSRSRKPLPASGCGRQSRM